MTDVEILQSIINITNQFLEGYITKDEMSNQIVIILDQNGKI